MNAVSIIALVLAVVSLVGVGLVWFLLSQIKGNTDRLLQEHPLPKSGREVEQRIEQAFQAVEAERKKTLNPLAIPFSQRMDIVGFVDQDFRAENDIDGTPLTDSRLIEIPPGTTQIIPSITYYRVAFGQPNEHPDHHLYNLNLSINYVIQDQVTAQATAYWWLADSSLSEKWQAAMSVRFLCLVPHQ